MSHLCRLLIILAACDAEPSDPEYHLSPVAPPIPIPVPTDDPEVAVRMAGHFRDSVMLRDAVIAGELNDVRAPARRLAERADPFPEAWRPFLIANVGFARSALGAKEIHVAAQAAAGLARTCGDCHAALAAGPSFDPPQDLPAPAPHDMTRHMQRHQWAADRMWDALISRSEYAWMVGAAALADPPLDRNELMRNVELADDVLKLNERIHALGSIAGTTLGWNARAEVYGEFLATCAGCHQGGC